MEALITSLRTHLARLTSELSSHRELLAELRSLRDIDSVTLREKSSEITQLKNEVERLAGEVEVLRGVVEEGLRERRAAKEASLQHDSGYQEELHQDTREFAEEERDHVDEEETDEESEDEEVDVETETEDAAFSYANDASRVRNLDKTMRTDHATEGSSRANDPRRAYPMDNSEFERISAEIDDRRSDRSGSANLSQFSRTRSPVQSPSPKPRRSKTMDYSVAYDMSTMARRASSPDPLSDPEDALQEEQFSLAPGPSRRSSGSGRDNDTRRSRKQKSETEAPFPKIRGEQLERLFFAAPEHDSRTCTTCNRRRQGSSGTQRATRQTRPRQGGGDQDDEGFAEELDEVQSQNRGEWKRRERSLQDIDEVSFVARQEGLPPQTIVARIIRELEDDFTHYKR